MRRSGSGGGGRSGYDDEYEGEGDDEYGRYDGGDYEDFDDSESPEGAVAYVSDEPEPTNRVFTIPNLISLARLAGVPVFLGLILSPYYGGPKYDGWAILLLAVSGFSDWLDGKLARRWNQMSKVGAFLDPLADRLYILATLVGFTMRHVIPLWLVIVLVGRDVALLVGVAPRLRRAGFGTTLPVHFLGKAATFNLLYAFPLLLLGQVNDGHGALANVGNIFGWAFVGWGTALYLYAGALYFVQTRQVLHGPLAR
jgi:cardiolipin synthase